MTSTDVKLDSEAYATGPVERAPLAVDRVGEEAMRSILLFFVGVPIPVILLLALCTHHF